MKHTSIDDDSAADDKLRFLAEYKVGRKMLNEFVKAYSFTHFAVNGYARYVPDWYINEGGPYSDLYLKNTGHVYSEYAYKITLERDEIY